MQTKDIILPSKGIFYDQDSPLSRGKIKLRYMTAADEDILTDKSLAKREETFDVLLRALIQDDVNLDDVLSGDKTKLLIATRVLAYGPKYTFSVKSKETGEKKKHTINLSELEYNRPEGLDEMERGKSQFEFELPISGKKVLWRLLRHKDDVAIRRELKRLKKDGHSTEITTRLKRYIVSLDGEEDNVKIKRFVEKEMMARDSQVLRAEFSRLTPDMDMTFDFYNNEGDFEELPINLEPDFFFPTQTTTV